MTSGKIHLKSMAFYGYHGDVAEETTLGQRFIIDLTLTVDMSAVARSDDLQHTVDYARVFETTRSIVEHEPVKMLETLAARILDRLLVEFPRIEGATIVVKKPAVPLKGILDYVAVELTKTREEGLSGTR